MPSRNSVYVAIDSERHYQEAQITKAFNNGVPDGYRHHEVPAWLCFMRDYLTEAEHIASRDWSPECNDKVLHIIRKVVGLGVACMEQHGAPLRSANG